jgi:hypothetical protein
VLDEVVATVDGDVRVDDLIRFNVLNPTVHSWDLARAARVDDRLDTGLVGRCLALLDNALAAGSSSPAQLGFAPPVASPASSNDQARLLALTGRRT